MLTLQPPSIIVRQNYQWNIPCTVCCCCCCLGMLYTLMSSLYSAAGCLVITNEFFLKLNFRAPHTLPRQEDGVQVCRAQLLDMPSWYSVNPVLTFYISEICSIASKAQLQLQRVKKITKEMLECGEAAAVDTGTRVWPIQIYRYRYRYIGIG